MEKCPKCEDGWFESVGLTEYGSLAKRCDICGHKQTETCIENCPSCGDKLLGNIENAVYQVAFDSTNTYDGKSYTWKDGCYFQHMRIGMTVCKSCDRYAITDGIMKEDYEESYALLKETLGTEENIFDYIKWEFCVGSEPVASGDGWGSYRELYEFVDTPQVRSLDELKGKEKIK